MVRFWLEFNAAIQQIVKLMEKDIDWLLQKILSESNFLKNINLLFLRISPKT